VPAIHQQDAAEDRAYDKGEAKDGTDQTQGTAALFRRESVADYRRRYREDTACAKALHGTAQQ